MNVIYDNPEFQQYWDMTIKPLAMECCKGAELSDKFVKATTPEEIDTIEKQMKQSGRKDWDSASSINKMIDAIENPGTNGYTLVDVLYTALMSLESKNYDKKILIFRDNKEVKNYKRLTKALTNALDILNSN
ncbi:MAG: hypothetical protein ACP5OA_04130 [Candidatus Woesearchaeota archaeon]